MLNAVEIEAPSFDMAKRQPPSWPGFDPAINAARKMRVFNALLDGRVEPGHDTACGATAGFGFEGFGLMASVSNHEGFSWGRPW
ncbi:MAG: hypothetical protein WAN43_15355 [Rhodomicrobium sp.]